jgi:hypothetical protein
MKLEAHQQPAVMAQLGEGALHFPAVLVAAQGTATLSLVLIRSPTGVRGDHFDAYSSRHFQRRPDPYPDFIADKQCQAVHSMLTAPVRSEMDPFLIMVAVIRDA